MGNTPPYVLGLYTGTITGRVWLLAVALGLACFGVGVAPPRAGAAGPVPPSVVFDSISDLGTFGGTASFSEGIDEDGVAVGDAELPDGTYHAFRGKTAPLVDLGATKAAGAYNRALGVSPSGRFVTGWTEPEYGLQSDGSVYMDEYHQRYEAARWSATAGFADVGLDTLGGYSYGVGCHRPPNSNAVAVSTGKAVNDAGTVVGVSSWLLGGCNPDAPPASYWPLYGHAFRYDLGDQKMEDLGTFDSAPGGIGKECSWSGAYDVNASGAVVGTAGAGAWGGWGARAPAAHGGCAGTTSDEYLHTHAFLLPAGAGEGSMIDLGQPAGGTGDHNYSVAVAINDRGQIAINGDDGTNYRAYRYEHGTTTALGSFGGSTFAEDINSDGDIVGKSELPNGREHAFLWHKGALIDLNDLLPADSPWTLARASGINDAGEISGTGVTLGPDPDGPGEFHAFILKLKPFGIDVLSGPTGTTSSRTATFEFSGPTNLPTECTLDTGVYEACTSPVSYPGLVDGSHTFAVRGHKSGRAPGAPTVQSWKIESTRPVALIDSAPSGAANGPSATFTFHASKPGSTFTCAIDDGVPRPCESPSEVSGLSPGPHRLSVVATDSVGNASTPTVATWTVGEARREVQPATTSCPGAAQPTAASGRMFVVGRSGTCLEKGTLDGRVVWKASGTVTVNGITVIPAVGTFVVLSASGERGIFRTTGPSTVAIGLLAPVNLTKSFVWHESSTSAVELLDTAASELFEKLGDLKLGGLKIRPGVGLDLSADDGGTTKLTLNVTLPAVFSAVPGSVSVTGSVSLIASNDKGVFLAGKVKADQAWLGPLKFKDIEAGYDDQSQTWEGGLSLVLGAGQDAPELRLTITIGTESGAAPALVGCCVRKLSLTLQGLNKPIPDTPFFLQKIGGEASRELGTVGGRQQSYLKFGVTVGISLGPELPLVDTGVVNLEGTGSLSLSDPWQLELAGKGSILKWPIANSKITYTHGQGVTLAGGIDLTLGGYGATGSIRNAFFEGRRQYNIEAIVDVDLPVFGATHGEAIFSTKGMAACAVVHTLFQDTSIGWGMRADGSLVQLAGVCDIGEFRVTANAGAVRRVGRAAGFDRHLMLRAHDGVRVIAVRGGGAGAPAATLSGPNGFSLSVGQASTSPSGAVIPDDEGKTTYFVLANAPAGDYTLTSPARDITAVSTADSLPPVNVSAATRPAGGGQRLLLYSQTPVPGQTLELYEQSSEGGAGQLLTRTSSATGRVRFRPTTGLGARRQILAVTLKGGLARDRRTLAPFTVADRRPPAVGGLTRRGRRVVWRATPRASQYAVSFTTAAGDTTSRTTPAQSVRYPSGAAQATVVALDPIGRFGPSRTLKLASTPKPTRKPAAKHGDRAQPPRTAASNR